MHQALRPVFICYLISSPRPLSTSISQVKENPEIRRNYIALPLIVVGQIHFPTDVMDVCSNLTQRSSVAFPSHLYHSSSLGHNVRNNTQLVFRFLNFFFPINSVIAVNIPNQH